MSFVWDKAKTDLAVDMWNRGDSTGKIAGFFGVTKNAIIGKISRMRVKDATIRREPVGAPKQSAPRKRTPFLGSPKRETGKTTIEAPIVIPPAQPALVLKTNSVSIMGLRRFGQCRYIVSEPDEPVLYCGGDSGAKTYCPDHHAICYRRREPDEKE